jgi:hypothetical protein
MPDLLHEYWEDESGGDFGPVREDRDRLRLTTMPDASLIFSLYASSWFQAMQQRNQRLGYADYTAPDDLSDYVYTDQEKAEQDRYLNMRNLAPG